MTHLTDREFVDLLDGRLAGERLSHVEWCAACRAQRDGLRAALTDALLDEIPEPSPLFWDSLSARVADAVRTEPIASGRAWLTWPHVAAVRGALAAAALVAAIALSWNLRTPRESHVPPPAAPAIAAGAASPISPADVWLDDPESDEAWAVVRSAAAGLEWEDVQAAGITPSPASVEHAAMTLTPEERSELARLIEDELRRNGS